MSSTTAPLTEVFTAAEIARAAGVSPSRVDALVTSGAVDSVDGRFISADEAVRLVRSLRDGDARSVERSMFAAHAVVAQARGRGLLASAGLHGLMAGALALVTTMGVASAPREVPQALAQMRLVFLATPGPGGGGGGGGLKQPAPPPKALLKGTSPRIAPVPRPKPITTRPPQAAAKPVAPPPVRPVERSAEPPAPPPPPSVPTPQVVAPVASAASDARDRAGVLAESTATEDSSGPGSGGGAGTGRGTGIGEGDGSGIGPGSGGGTGGGPYRPGSGITPPTVLREVRPDYTEEGRRRNISGEVVLEIVVRADGTVGAVKLLEGLGAGLDQRAIEAVRQWRFSPARRLGTPVDVLVEVAVEFKLR